MWPPENQSPIYIASAWGTRFHQQSECVPLHLLEGLAAGLVMVVGQPCFFRAFLTALPHNTLVEERASGVISPSCFLTLVLGASAPVAEMDEHIRPRAERKGFSLDPGSLDPSGAALQQG